MARRITCEIAVHTGRRVPLCHCMVKHWSVEVRVAGCGLGDEDFCIISLLSSQLLSSEYWLLSSDFSLSWFVFVPFVVSILEGYIISRSQIPSWR